MDLLNETVRLKTKTLFNVLIRETSRFLCYERLLNMTYVAECLTQDRGAVGSSSTGVTVLCP